MVTVALYASALIEIMMPLFKTMMVTVALYTSALIEICRYLSS